MLFCQIFYYRWKHRQPLLKSLSSDDSEGAPLLPRTEGGARHLSTRNLIIRYTAVLAFISTVGVAAWYVAGNNHEQAPGPMSKQTWWKSQILGWISAFLFVCSFHNVVTLISLLISCLLS